MSVSAHIKENKGTPITAATTITTKEKKQENKITRRKRNKSSEKNDGRPTYSLLGI